MNLAVISGFEWDDGNITHIEKHEFTPDEVEEVFVGDHKIRRTRQKRYISLGETLDGRLAFVVFRRLPGGLVRVRSQLGIWTAVNGGYFAASRWIE